MVGGTKSGTSVPYMPSFVRNFRQYGILEQKSCECTAEIGTHILQYSLQDIKTLLG